MAKDIPEAYLGLVRTLWHRREPGRKDAEINKEIKSHLEQAIKLRPDYYEAISLFGFLLWSEGNFDEAFSMQRRALRLKPSFAAGYYGLGLGYASNGKVDEALAMLRQASSLDPEDSEYRTQLGLYISVFKRDHARALKHMIRALDLPGVVSWNHTMLAYVQLMAGDAMSCLKTLSQSPTRGPLNKVHAEYCDGGGM